MRYCGITTGHNAGYKQPLWPRYQQRILSRPGEAVVEVPALLERFRALAGARRQRQSAANCCCRFLSRQLLGRGAYRSRIAAVTARQRGPILSKPYRRAR